MNIEQIINIVNERIKELNKIEDIEIREKEYFQIKNQYETSSSEYRGKALDTLALAFPEFSGELEKKIKKLKEERFKSNADISDASNF